MRIFEGISELLKEFPMGLKGSVLTLGNFDGIHRGHQKLLETLKSEASKVSFPVVVMTFQPHPVKILAPERDIFRLFSLEDQARELEKQGVDFLIRQPFNLDLAKTTAEDFLKIFLIDPLRPAAFIVGHDFHFGKDRAGNAAFLQSHAASLNYKVVQVRAYEIQKKIVSSTRIRELLRDAELTSVHELLGRNYSTEGIICQGDGRGEKLGFPTANLIAPKGWPLPKGVYVTSVQMNQKTYTSITNVGLNPTFEDPNRALQVESFIFDLNKDIYGETIKVEFFKFLRAEKKFTDAQELIQQIGFDIKQAKEFWYGRS